MPMTTVSTDTPDLGRGYKAEYFIDYTCNECQIVVVGELWDINGGIWA